jgi:hypothetical protein
MITIGSISPAPDQPAVVSPPPASSHPVNLPPEKLPPVNPPPVSEETEPPKSEQSKKPFPLMAIPITLSVGLLVAAVYLGQRIVVARLQSTPPVREALIAPRVTPPALAILQPKAPVVPKRTEPAPAATQAVKTPAPVANLARIANPAAIAENRAIAPKPVEPTAADSHSNELIVPESGQRYLQIAAISSQAVSWFTDDMRRKNLQVRLAPGPHEGLVRVLIGPFPDWDSLREAKTEIQKAWPDCFVRVY